MENTFTPLKDALASQGKSFSQENLNALAKTAGIENYKSTNDQNKQLAQMLQKTTPASNATVSNANVSPIALNQLNTQAVNIPQPAPVSTQTAPVAPQNFANDFLQQTQVEDTQAQKSASNLSLAISSLIPELQGQAEATAQAEKVAGVDRYRQELQGINNQILMKTAEINQDDIRLAQSLQNIEDKPIAMEFITGQQSSVQRNAQLARALKQADIGILNARAIGTQGNVQLAVDTAKQAVDLKYAPMKETIATYEAQLKALEPILNADEKKQARAQEVKTKLALNELEQKQAGEKALQEIIINASSQGAPASLVSRAEKAKTPAQAAMILGQYAGDFYKTELLKAQIASQKANTAESYAKIRAAAAQSAQVGQSLAVNINGKPVKVPNNEITDLNQAIISKNSINSLIDDYKKIIQNTGTQTLFGKDAGKREALKTNIIFAMKNLEKTGALDKGSVDVLSGSIPDSAFFNTEGGQLAKLDELKSTVNGKADELIKSYKGTTAELDPRTKRAYELNEPTNYVDTVINSLSGTAKVDANSYINNLIK